MTQKDIKAQANYLLDSIELIDDMYKLLNTIDKNEKPKLYDYVMSAIEMNEESREGEVRDFLQNLLR
jgi:uncharacterized membrane protein